MKGFNRYIVISLICVCLILMAVIYLLNKPYIYNELNDYIMIDDHYFDDYNTLLLHGSEFPTGIDIPLPDKKGLLIEFNNNTEEEDDYLNFGKSHKLEIHVNEGASYSMVLLEEDDIVYETEIRESKTSFNYEMINNNFDQILLKAGAGDSFTVHYIGIQDQATTRIFSEIEETGLVRSQYKDIKDIDENIKEAAIQDPYAAIGAQAFYESSNDETITISVLNIHERVITLLGLETDKGKTVASIDHVKIEPMDMNLISNPNDLTYHKFELRLDHKYDLDELYLRYYISGSAVESVVKLNIFSRYNNDLYNETMVNRESNIDSFEFISVNDHIISFTEDINVIDHIMFIPQGYTLAINEGQEIDLVNGAYIYSKSIIDFDGSSEQPIRVYSSDGTGKGIFINQTNSPSDDESRVNHTIFDGLDTPSSGAFVLTGAVSFYHSDVTINNSQFLNNQCEDSLNIVSSEFSIRSCYFENAPSDCLDGDFSKGSIIASTFKDIDGDAIDFSASEIEVYNCEMSSIKDKGVSGGEKSTVIISDLTIEDAQIGLASKDSSKVYGERIYITNTKIGYMLYQKKPEYGGGFMEIIDSQVEDNGGIPYLLETGSELFIDNRRIDNEERKNQDEIIEKVINGEPIE